MKNINWNATNWGTQDHTSGVNSDGANSFMPTMPNTRTVTFGKMIAVTSGNRKVWGDGANF